MNLLKKLKDERGILIAVHRGCYGGNIIQNTVKSIINAKRHKGDIVEIDILRSSDGEFFAFHDGQEKILFHKDIDIRKLTAKEIKDLNMFNALGETITQKVNTLDEILKSIDSQVIINIDRSWFYWDSLLEKLANYQIDNILLKSPVDIEWLNQLREIKSNIMYMPIVKNIKELDTVLNFDGINIVAMELIFDSLAADLIQKEVISKLHNKGILLWVNSIRINDKIKLSADLDDEAALLDNGQTYETLLNLGFDIIQTDLAVFGIQIFKTK